VINTRFKQSDLLAKLSNEVQGYRSVLYKQELSYYKNYSDALHLTIEQLRMTLEDQASSFHRTHVNALKASAKATQRSDRAREQLNHKIHCLKEEIRSLKATIQQSEHS